MGSWLVAESGSHVSSTSAASESIAISVGMLPESVTYSAANWKALNVPWITAGTVMFPVYA